jgi:glycosyltransferase involved in cell wall biosynthesis
MTRKKEDPPVLGMILKGYPRISETFISNEILLLERMGFRVRIFSMRHPREAFSHESVKRIRAKVDYLPQELLRPLPILLRHNLLLAVRTPRRYGAALKTAVRRWLRTRKSATLKHLFQAGYLVHKLLPGSGVVRFHSHFAHSPTSVALFAGRLSGLPFSFTAHAKDIYTQNPKQIAEKIRLARFVVTCTEYNRRYLSTLAPEADTPLYRIYHGIDMTLFSGEEGIRAPAEPYRVLTVARLTAKKGLPTLYRAIRILRDRGVELRHTLIGDGDDREEILALIRSLELTDVCEWAGTLPHEKVLDHYRRSHLFALACEVAPNGDRDGIPNVLIESMAMGVPVVSTRISAIPELVRDGETGLLVDPEDPEGLADAMSRLLTDAELRKRIIPAAGAFVAERFNNAALIGELAEIHRSHLDR